VLILFPLALIVGIFASDKYEYCPMSVLAIIRLDSLVDVCRGTAERFLQAKLHICIIYRQNPWWHQRYLVIQSTCSRVYFKV